MRSCLVQELLEPATAPEAGRLGRGANPHAVLRHHAQRHQLALEQRGDAAGQLRIEPRDVPGAKVRQRVVVHPHAAADPAIRVIALAQPIDLACRAHAIDGRPQPQRHQNRRVDCRTARHTFHRLDLRVQRLDVQRLHERPHGACGVITAQQRVQVAGAKFDLVALRHHHTGYPSVRRFDRLARRCRDRQLALIEQRRAATLGLSFGGVGAHAPIIAEASRLIQVLRCCAETSRTSTAWV